MGNCRMGPKVHGSHKLRYHVYLIQSDVHLKNGIAFVYGEALTVRVAIRADWEAVRVVYT